jgi:hypothetical protein
MGDVGRAIQPSRRAVSSWSPLGMVTMPCAAARAVSAAMTASRAWSEDRQSASYAARSSHGAVCFRRLTSSPSAVRCFGFL